MIARVYRYLAWLSLDVTAGAVVFMHFLSREFEILVHWSEMTALGISVWLIYSIDHILDARAAKEPISPRREFHKQRIHFLLFLNVFVLCIGFWVLAQLTTDVLIAGGIIAFVALGYLVFVRIERLSGIKEVQIAIGYTGGVSLVPLLYLEKILVWHWMSIVLLFLIALGNLILFSWFELNQDQKEGFTSLVQTLGTKRTKTILEVVFIANILGALIMYQFGGTLTLAIFFLLAGAINFCISKYKNFFEQHDRYRIIGDAVFLLPILWLL